KEMRHGQDDEEKERISPGFQATSQRTAKEQNKRGPTNLANKPDAQDLGAVVLPEAPLLSASPDVLNRLWTIIDSRRDADPAVSHSARLLARGTPQVVQKLG